MLELKNISKSYGNTPVLHNLSFTASRGDIIGFLGPNGAGKSTTMKLIVGYHAPTSGDIFFKQKNIQENRTAIKKAIGYLPEKNPLYPDMLIPDYLSFMGKFSGVASSQLPKRISEVMESCHLHEVKKKYIGELSKGYQQRVGLAQALLHDPALLILDEPTAGLDPNQVIEIRELIKKLGEEKIIILSNHILQEVEQICNRILILHRGNLVLDSSFASLKNGTQSLQEIFHSLTTA